MAKWSRSRLRQRALQRCTTLPRYVSTRLTVVTISYTFTACDTALTEPDDVVVCSLQPTNDYKTVRIY